MMHTTCLNSSVSLRCRSSRFDVPTCFLDARFETNPLLFSTSFASCCCCSCCCCCANSNTNSIYSSLPRIYPSFLCNGLRQSTLIQFSPSKRLIFHGRRRQSCNGNSAFSSLTDSDRNNYYEKLQSFKRGKQGGLRKGRYGCWALEDKRKEQFFSNEIDDDHVDDVEILLDLLTEEAGLEYLGVREQKRIEKKDPRFATSKTKVVGSVKRDLKCDNKVVEVRSRKEEDRRLSNERKEEERGTSIKGVNRERKKEGSSSSSYYSVSSTGEFESENDVEVKHDGCFVRGESSNEYKDDRKRDDYRSYDEEIEENVDRRQEFGKEESEILKKNTALKYYGNEEWRKKSEKKLNIESSQHQSHVSVNTERNSQQHSKKAETVTNPSQSRMKYTGLMEKQYSDTENNLNTSVQELAGEHRGETAENVSRQDEYRRQSNVISESSGIHKINMRESSSSSTLEARMKNRKENVTEVSGQIEDRREEKFERMDQLTTLKDARVKSQQISDTHITNTKNTRVSSQQSDIRRQKQELHMETSSSSHEARMKNGEESSTEVSGQVEDRREEKLERLDQLTTLRDSRVKSQQISETSDTRVTNTKNSRVSSRQSDIKREKQELHLETSGSSHEARIKNWEENSTEVSGQVEDRREEKLQRMDQLTTLKDSGVQSLQISGISDTHIATTENTRVSSQQSDIRNKKQELHLDTSSSAENVTSSTRTGRRTTKASSFHVGMPKETSSTYKALKLNPEPNLQETGAHGAGKSSSEISKLTHEHSSQRFETITDELQEQPPKGSRVQQSEILGGDIGGDSVMDPSSFISHEDAISSADQQQKSSSHFVGEFVKKAKHELSTSEVLQEKKTHEDEFVYEDAEQHELKTPGEDGSGNSDQKDGGRGPSDEMWHETGTSVQQPSETDAPENTSSTGNGESVKKSGRSLWNVIGDVVRLRWVAPRSETHTSKSGGGKASSNQSTSSEAWFSGHEPEESNDDNVKTGSAKGRSQSKKEVSNPSSSKDSPLLSSSSSNANQGSSSKHMSPSVIRMRRSPVVKRTSVTDETDAYGSGEMVKTEQPVPKMTEMPPADASGSGKMVIVDHSKDEELKRRKLARIDQVSKDRFDEWEEAYTVETKQRKNDELFMREALLEAKKAADFWEVPVGAVLVQDGKIIARGYNLVEELRDSTAHAEMICIREASNNLRSWRLSGTTLYVTLEPCAMCAGAILQARIDTVVWGAPNKLLGADGSWIRLFPDGDGGSGSDKPAAPVHPFHPNMTVRRGVLSSECAEVMQQFFQLRRKKKAKKTEAEPATPPPPSSCLPITHHHHSKLFSKMHDAFSIMFCL
ncbi:tRNA(adenine(34)) deaminase, chloroplastic [Cynara cardunculus var. scolymus]|uniref:tRNA(adenine(34)) deaminase n=1 Tax=Cynara cardunculus var. scolymus TaxID=59895 RepID=A0A103XV94_CYNCS|nr:tRNA(adenine(34)) deaminase, chloroplastic [Cynara cardunculus var. scolymus]KVH97518.1 CMP/dCMP deaminase, zinc-binding [Cynara cardunculus var. scolymus]